MQKPVLEAVDEQQIRERCAAKVQHCPKHWIQNVQIFTN